MATMTHYLLAGSTTRALCGQEPGPIDLGPYGGHVSCLHCRSIDLSASFKAIGRGPRAEFFSAAGPITLRP
jgi:hypothetical protein